jgi:hypothetical protein
VNRAARIGSHLANKEMAEKQDNCKRQDCDAAPHDQSAALPTIGYARSGPGGTTRFEPAVSQQQPQRSEGNRGGNREPITRERARAFKLLAAIKRAPRRQGQLGRDRITGQLGMGTRIYAALADAEKRPRNAGEMRRWARGIDGATPELIEKHISIAMRQMTKDWPTSRDIGNALRLTEMEWCNVYGCTKLVLPYDIESEAEIDRITRDISNQKAVVRNERSRRRKGAKARSTSAAAIARRLNMNRKTVAAWIKAGKIDPETGELLARFDTPPTSIIKNRKRIENGHPPRKAAPRAPLPETKEDATDMTSDAPADAADATRPVAAPGDARPDDDAPAEIEPQEPARATVLALGPWGDDEGYDAEQRQKAADKARAAERAQERREASPADAARGVQRLRQGRAAAWLRPARRPATFHTMVLKVPPTMCARSAGATHR